MILTGYNPTDAPVVVDALGHMIGGGEWGTYDSTADEVKAAIEAGTLVHVDVDIDAVDNPSAAAQAAFKRTKKIKEREDKVKPDKDDDKKPKKADLHEAAADAGLIAPTDDVSVSDLRTAVATSPHVPIPQHEPEPKPRKRTRTQED